MHSLGHVNFHTYLTEVIVYQIVVVFIARWCYHLESPCGPMVLSSIRNRSVGIVVVCKERLSTASLPALFQDYCVWDFLNLPPHIAYSYLRIKFLPTKVKVSLQFLAEKKTKKEFILLL